MEMPIPPATQIDADRVMLDTEPRWDNTNPDVNIPSATIIDEKKITLLKEKIEKMNRPYKVEIVNFQHVSQNFQKIALKDAIVWKD